MVLNTLFGDREGEGDLSPGHRMAARPVVGEMVFEVLLSIFENLPRTQGDPDSLPAEVLELYARPVEESGNDKAPLAMMRMVPNGPDHPSARPMQAIGQYVRGWTFPRRSSGAGTIRFSADNSRPCGGASPMRR